MKLRKLRIADLFCGAGGSTTGVALSKYGRVVYALNHWPTAIDSHAANHPDVKHRCAPIERVNPREDVPPIDVLIASPECTHYSIARGGKPFREQKRATAWDVIHWTEALMPRWVVVENVREFLNWGPIGTSGRPLKSKRGETFSAWRHCLESLSYTVDWSLLNAADFGAATSRVRLFVVARRDGRSTKKPIPWPEPTHAAENHKPAAEVIDFERPCPSIFTRKKPLADNTLKRIAAGIRKFCNGHAEPFLVKLRGTSDDAIGKWSATDPQKPLPTITAGGGHLALAQPFVLQQQSGGVPRSTDEPLPTIATAGAQSLIQPFLMKYHAGKDRKGDERVYPVGEPIRTIDTQNRHAIVQPFLTTFYGTGGPRSVDQPLSTITSKHRHGLALVQLMEKNGIVDIGFRMLDVDELARATGFPDDYYLAGTKADQVRQIGNAVAPAVMKALIDTIGKYEGGQR